jgi:hypothetical protein
VSVFFFGLVGVPLLYLITVCVLLFRRDARGIGLSLLFFAAAVATGVWAILQSRSSTAGIGFLGIPLVGGLGGFLGLAFGRYRSSTELPRRIGAWIGLAAALLLVSFNIAQGTQTRAKNKVRDDKQAEFSAAIARDREIITADLKQNPSRQRIYLDSSILANMNDRAFLLAALPNDSISPEILDTLASSDDLNIALEAVRNPATQSATLERVYRTKSYPDYFFQALAAHRNTSPAILNELYHRPQTITGLDIWFAGNPSTPRPILLTIAGTDSSPHVLMAILGNPALDCGILSAAASNLMKKQNRDADDPTVQRVTELVPEKCDRKPAE